MPTFHYQAVDASGNQLAGECEAPDQDAALRQLAEQGLTSIQLVPVASVANAHDVPLARLSFRDAEEVLGHVTHATLAESTLVAGLRAAAADASNRRVAAALWFLANEISRGRSLSDTLADATVPMPPHVRGLVDAGIRTGRLGPVMDELMDHHRRQRAMFWGIWSSLAYPLFVAGMTLTLLVCFLVGVVPQFEALFREMELRLPAATEFLLSASHTMSDLVFGPAKWALLAGLIALFAAMCLSATGRGGSRVQLLLGLMPVFGPLWTWSGTASFMTLLSTLLEQRVPLPEALQLTADGMNNHEFRRAARWLAEGVRSGQSLSQLVESSGCLPLSSVPLLRWGEGSDVLAEATRTLADMFTERLAARTAWLRSTSPPVIYLIIVVSIGFAITSLFVPVISLIQGLL